MPFYYWMGRCVWRYYTGNGNHKIQINGSTGRPILRTWLVVVVSSVLLDGATSNSSSSSDESSSTLLLQALIRSRCFPRNLASWLSPCGLTGWSNVEFFFVV